MKKGKYKKYQIYIPEIEAEVLDKAVEDSGLPASAFVRYHLMNMLRQRGYCGNTSDRP